MIRIVFSVVNLGGGDPVHQHLSHIAPGASAFLRSDAPVYGCCNRSSIQSDACSSPCDEAMQKKALCSAVLHCWGSETPDNTYSQPGIRSENTYSYHGEAPDGTAPPEKQLFRHKELMISNGFKMSDRMKFHFFLLPSFKNQNASWRYLKGFLIDPPDLFFR